VFNMELTPVMSRVRPAAMLCGGAAVVCLVGAWLTPVSAGTAYPTSSSQDAAAVHLGWLGVSSDDSSSSSDSAAAAPTKAKPASTANTDSADADKSSKASSASGVGDVLHSVFSGVGRLFSSLFGR
jgi:hypothetical protein